jgi:hypothetical protein
MPWKKYIMNSDAPLCAYDLADGLRAVVRDETRHYYGGYFHVTLRVEADVTLVAGWFESPALFEDACGRLGSTIRFCRTLEKMAVPGDEVDAVKQDLLSSFESNLLPYLARPDFPSRFAISEYGKSLKSPAILKGIYQ